MLFAYERAMSTNSADLPFATHAVSLRLGGLVPRHRVGCLPVPSPASNPPAPSVTPHPVPSVSARASADSIPANCTSETDTSGTDAPVVPSAPIPSLVLSTRHASQLSEPCMCVEDPLDVLHNTSSAVKPPHLRFDLMLCCCVCYCQSLGPIT